MSNYAKYGGQLSYGRRPIQFNNYEYIYGNFVPHINRCPLSLKKHRSQIILSAPIINNTILQTLCIFSISINIYMEQTYVPFVPTYVINVYLQNGGGCDQKPVSVHTMLASPTNKWPSVQLNVTKAPTAYRRWLAEPLVPSIRPFIGTSGWGH